MLPSLGSSSTTRAPRRKRLKHFSGRLEPHLSSHRGAHFLSSRAMRDGVRRGRRAVPVRKMTLSVSQALHPTVPHEWLCDGKLLLLNDPANQDNISLFQVG